MTTGTRFSQYILSFFIRILFFWPRLNIPIFLPILGWKYSCNILNYSLWHFRVRMYCCTFAVQFMSFASYSRTAQIHYMFRSSLNNLTIASKECFVCWLVLPFRERNNLIQLNKNISLYCVYRFSHEIIFFSQFQPQVYS